MRSVWFFLTFRLVLLAFLSFFIACKRAPKVSRGLDHDFVQGQEEGLYRVEDIVPQKGQAGSGESKASLPGSTAQKRGLNIDPVAADSYSVDILKTPVSNLDSLLKIRTASKGEKVKISFVQENIYIDPKISFINEYEFLEYQILPPKTKWQKRLARWLGQVDKFKGFPDTEYYILPHYEGNFLILYKVATPDKIPYDERPIAKTIGDMLAVPLVGYPIKYCRAVNIPGPLHEKTLRYRALCEGVSLSEAEYVHLEEK